MGSVKLTAKQEGFAQKYVETGSATDAYRFAYDCKSMGAPTIHVEACKLVDHPKISIRIAELKKIASEVAEERFTVSIEQRLRWLDEIVKAGLEKQIIQKGESMVEQRENLSASNKAIEILNAMLGTGEDESEKGEEIAITFNVSQPVRDVKVTHGK